MLDILFWVFIAGASIQFIFLLLLIIVFLFYKSPKIQDSQVPGISVVICAKNEIENLKVLIPKLLTQEFHKFEIILVDDRSSDDTYDYCIELSQKEKRFKHVRLDSTPDHINNKKYAITLGIKAAKFEHILLTDADCIPASNHWIEEMSKGFTNENKIFVIGYSQYSKANGFLNWFIKYETSLTALNYFGIGLLGRPYMAVGRNIAYRKSFFLENNGFGKYQHVVGGDDDLLVNQYAKRRNTTLLMSPESTVYSKPKLEWRDFVMQKTRHLSVGKHYRSTDKLILGALILSKILFWFGVIAAIMSAFKTYLVLGVFLLVLVSLLTAFSLLGRNTADKSRLWLVPILDFTYIFYYISTGLKVLLTKKVRWK